MKIENLILFSDVFRKLLQKLNTFLTLFKRALIILIRWNKRLSVKSLQINDSFLLSNGLLIINWELKNFLWVKISNKIFTINSKGIIFHYDKIDTPIAIRVVGLFGKYEKDFTINPIAAIRSQNIPSPIIKANKLKIGEVQNSITQFMPKNFSFSLMNKNLTSNIKPINIILPTFKMDNYHE